MRFIVSFDIYMKWKLDYSIFVLHINFFLDDLEFQVNQENIHLTLTMLKVVLALKHFIFAHFLLIKGYGKCALRKESVIAHFVERYKTAILSKPYW